MLRLDSKTIPGMNGNSGGGNGAAKGAAGSMAAQAAQRKANKAAGALISGIDDSSSVKDVAIRSNHGFDVKVHDHNEGFLI